MIDPDSFTKTSTTWIQLLLNSFIIIGVNTYVFISGYFGIKIKIKKLLLFITQVIFFSVVLYIAMVSLGLIEWNIGGFIMSFIPIYDVWWFFYCYMALYILSPFLNKGLEILNKGQIIFILILLFIFMRNGRDILGFTFIYVLGYYLKHYLPIIKKPQVIYLVASVVIFIISYIFFIAGKFTLSWHMFSYKSPLVIISACAFFFTFLKINIKNKWINRISPFVFGAYLLHEYPPIQKFLEQFINNLAIALDNDIIFYGSLPFLAVVIFIVGIGFDKIRLLICEPCIDYVLKQRYIKKITDYFSWPV